MISVVPDGPLHIEPHELELTLDGERLEVFTVGRTIEPGQRRSQYAEADAREVRVRVSAGPHRIGAAFLRKTAAEQERTRKLYRRPFTGEGSGGDSRYQPYLDRVTITGPFESRGSRPAVDTPSRARIFVCEPDGDAASAAACAADILSTLARRAYRRPVTGGTSSGCSSSTSRGRPPAGSTAASSWPCGGCSSAPSSCSASSRIRRVCRPAPPTPLGDLELASRLSFFLWSSIPDDELLDVAGRGELRDPAVLEAQTRRMLDDPRAEALVANFAGQWLSLRNAAAVQPDEDLFPDFGENLRQGSGARRSCCSARFSAKNAASSS